MGEIIEIIESGNRPKGGVGNIEEGVFSLGGEHIHANNGYLNLSNPKYIPLEFYQNSTRGKIEENDILICKDGALTGKVAIVRKEFFNSEAMVNEHLFKLRCLSLDKQKYIFYFLLASQGQTLLKANITGSAQGGINSTNLKSIKIPLPLKSVQEQIVKECEAVDKAVDKAEKEILDYKNEIEQEVQQVISAGYAMKKIGEIFETSSGGTPSSRNTEYYQGGDIPWINSGEVSKRKIFKADKYITELGLKNSSAKLFPKDTVLLAMYGATAGKVALLNIEATTNQALCAFLPTKEVLPYFLLLHLETMYQTLLDMRTGVARDNLSQEKIKNIKIPVPPLNIQKNLIQKIEKLEQKINDAKAIADNAPIQKEQILKKHL